MTMFARSKPNTNTSNSISNSNSNHNKKKKKKKRRLALSMLRLALVICLALLVSCNIFILTGGLENLEDLDFEFDINDWIPDLWEYTVIGDPKISRKNKIVIFVFSARANTGQRQAIRDTWGRQDDDAMVYFVLGQSCPHAPHLRPRPEYCAAASSTEPLRSDTTISKYDKVQHRLHRELVMEQREHGDLILTLLPENSATLPNQIITAYQFAVTKLHKGIRWIVKINDDMYVRQNHLRDYLDQFNPTIPTLVGRFHVELSQQQQQFIAPHGGVHAMSLPLANYIANHKDQVLGMNEEGEDSFLGEWVATVPGINFTYALGAFLDYGDCTHPSYAIMGSSIDAARMKECHDQREDAIPLPLAIQPIKPNILSKKAAFAATASADDAIVLVLSDRSSGEQRNAIRTTWGLLTTVYFVVDNSDPCLSLLASCRVEQKYNLTYSVELQQEQEEVIDEQRRRQDMIFTTAAEVSNSVSKLKEAVNLLLMWLPESRLKWFVVVHDDSYIRVKELEQLLAAKYDDSPRVIFGSPGKLTNINEQVDTSYPRVSSGFAFSRPVSQFMSLQNGELRTSSLGAWLEHSNLQVSKEYLTEFQVDGNCNEGNTVLVIGHGISKEMMRHCFGRENPDEFLKGSAAMKGLIWSDAKTVILVMSRRDNFEQRTAIRETWATGHANVLFIISSEACPFPPYQRYDELDCELDPSLAEDDPEYVEASEQDQELLRQEEETFQDIVFVPQQESYRSLPRKLKEAYAFAVEKTKARWIVKADDDFFVRVETISEYLSHYDDTQPSVLGRILTRDLVRKKGKWAEKVYRKRVYPDFPLGSTGHAVSRSVAEYIAANKETLFEYQGEDTSLGIWLAESGLEIQWTRARVFQNSGKCKVPSFYVIGHRITPNKMRECYERLDESIAQERKKPNWIAKTLEAIKPRTQTPKWINAGGEDQYRIRRAWFERSGTLANEMLDRKREWLRQRREGGRKDIQDRIAKRTGKMSRPHDPYKDFRFGSTKFQPPRGKERINEHKKRVSTVGQRTVSKQLRTFPGGRPQPARGRLQLKESRPRFQEIKQDPDIGSSRGQDPEKNRPVRVTDDQETQAQTQNASLTNQDPVAGPSPEKLQLELSRAPKFVRGPDGVPTEWIQPRLSEKATVVVVMSSRGNGSRRNAIRKTWGRGHDNVYFIVSPPCPFPKTQLAGLGLSCEKRPEMLTDPIDIPQQINNAYMERNLALEQEANRDMIYVSEPEAYLGLAHKLKEAYDWVVSRTNAAWIVKADDDSMVRVSSLEKYLQRFSPLKPTVLGRIIPNSPVQKFGKWIEHDFKADTYPPWPQGSCGHVVSRPVADYVAKHRESLHEYQGEDISLGIWLNESALKDEIVFIRSKSFTNDKNCSNPDALIIGHQMAPKDLRECYRNFDEIEQLPEDDIEPLEKYMVVYNK